MKEKQNSQILLAYLLIGFLYYLGNTPIRALLFGIVLMLSFVLIFSFKNQYKIGNKKEIVFKSFFLFAIVLLIQVFNETLTPFTLYILSAPILALFIIRNNFDTKTLKISIYIISVVFLLFFIVKRNLAGIFYQMSVNYVSVVLIMNVVIVNSIERIQKEKISILPSILALLFSLLAMGRAGILCTFLLVCNSLYFSWSSYTKRQKTGLLLLLVIPIVVIGLFKGDMVVDYISNLSVLERFDERGVDSPSRDILKREYIANLDIKNLLLGYNFIDNQWFIHYGQNPHNSYMRLHHFFGFCFLIVMGFIFKQVIKLFKIDKFLCIMVLVILLRSWTDSVLFLTVYDFVLVYLLLIPIYYKKESIIHASR